MDKIKLLSLLYENKEASYKEFQQKLLPGCKDILGVRLPLLHKLAKQILQEDWQAFLQGESEPFYEWTMLRGLVIARCPVCDEERLEYIEKFLSEIHNWGVCDSFCSSLHCFRDNVFRKKALPLIMQWALAKEEFIVRFAFVIMLMYYKEPAYLECFLQLCRDFVSTGYYAKMAVAWALSAYYVVFPQKIFEYLQSENDPLILSKTISKIRDLRSVSAEEKIRLRHLKGSCKDVC